MSDKNIFASIVSSSLVKGNKLRFKLQDKKEPRLQTTSDKENQHVRGTRTI